MDAAIEMYVPVYSTKLKQEPRGPELKLLLEVLDERERDRLLAHPEIGELSVELWTPASRLDPWIHTRLSAVYPGIQLTRCRVISVGLHEPSFFRAEHEWPDGILIMLAGAGIQVGWLAWRCSRQVFNRPGISAEATPENEPVAYPPR